MSTPASPLEQLHDVIPPSTAPWWPLSPAAFSLIAATVLLIALAIYFWRKRVLLNKAKKQALIESQQFSQPNLNNTQQLHLLLKRLVKHYYNVTSANTTGEQWCQCINAVSKVTLNQDELALLYQNKDDSAYSKLHSKLIEAIKRFKVKGAKHV